MRVAYICRGYPGLGKVMGALAIHQRLSRRSDYTGLFLSYDRGYAYLSAEHHPCEDLLASGGHIAKDGFCAPFAAEGRRVLQLLEEFVPALVVNDGEPYLVDISEEILGVSTLVLAHPLDVENSGNAHGVRLFRHFYRRASKVVAHGLRRLTPEACDLGERAGRVAEINTLVRESIWQAARSGALSCDGPAVCVLGGGSSNASGPFLERTIALGRWFIHACADLSVPDARVFCADERVYAALLDESRSSVELHATPLDNTQALASASVVVGRAGRNLASELLALGKRAVLVPVSGARFRKSGQVRTAERVITMTSAMRASYWEDGYEGFCASLARSLELPPAPPHWRPGNESIESLLPAPASSV